MKLVKSEMLSNGEGSVTVKMYSGSKLTSVSTMSDNLRVLSETRTWKASKAGKMLAEHHYNTTLNVLKEHYGLS